VQLVGEIRRYAAQGWRHRWKALALAWVVCLVGWAAVLSMPDRFQSSARVHADVDAVLGQTLRGIAIDSQTAAQVDLLQRTLLSRPNLERVIARTDLDLRVTDQASREALVSQLSRDIRIQPQTRTLFTLTYSDTDPRLAREVVNTVLNLFIESATATDRQQMENARAFVAQQIAAYETQLRETERRRAEFRARYLDILPSDTYGGISRLENARERRQALAGQIEDAEARRTLIRQQLEATPATLAGETFGGGGDGRLAEAERLLRELRLRFTEQHPDVVAQRNIVAELRTRGGGGGSAPRTGAARPNPLHEQMRVRLVDADGELASFQRQMRDLNAEVQRLEAIARNAPQVQAEFLNIDRDYAVLSRQYEELLGRRESLQVAGQARTAADRVRLEIVDPPTVPVTPSGPNRLLFSTAVLVAGLGAGGALAVLLVLLDRSFATVHDLRRLGLPVLGSITSLRRPAPVVVPALVFATGVVLLLGAYGAVLVGGPELSAQLPRIAARILA
jgi:polysaccharide chain length determinant protein (PEP-CTERM system associated)